MTIFALATPYGKSGVAVIRISGQLALRALTKLTDKPLPTPRLATLSVIRHPSTASAIDHALALTFPAPHSFTGEDVVELHTHGSLAVIRELLAALATIPGLRPAEPGEFTRRAFLNGKMDLTQAEGLADLINAETTAQKTQAMRQFQGEMTAFYENIRTRTIFALALMEAYIDFPDEEIPQSVLADWRSAVEGLRSEIADKLADQHRGERLRDGVAIVILGAPNAGKSSLLNALVKRDAAIVSQQAGTTRDVIEVHLDIAGYPVVLMDTAGLRETADSIEEEGVRRALSRAGQADIKLILFDGTEAPDAQTRALIDDNSIVVATKSDLSSVIRHPSSIPLSIKTQQGIDQLLAAIETRIAGIFSGGEGAVITRNRHRALLSEAHAMLSAALCPKPIELTCEELRLAAHAIAKITGKIEVDDVLDVIFKQFCIGK